MRMSRFLTIILLAMIPTMASGQMEAETGSNIRTPAPAEIPYYSKLSDADRARATIIAFSQCVVLREAHGVARVLSANPIGSNQNKLLSDLAIDDCLRYGELRMDATLLRGGLYAALYRLNYRKISPPLADQPIDFTPDIAGATGNEAQNYIGLRQFADCVVRKDPSNSRSLILSDVGSKIETADFSVLSSSFSACLAQGTKITFSKAVIHGLIAEALYREAVRPGVRPASAGKP
ncbi:hypothetical protein HZF05_17080 [Sphingomonas sp. CGMCC 1.13654]|uniref:Uncharacterized protein n=1 Tax=Sphingomonas chungangi TaxID=2683589 RepID=A0A838LAR0_9SPHN|nr:hypothetical protein [Sphingomonas chungangi]MBA2935795.1 hypothetical protein [Sphingomonas chungangi]MVW54486.1 hypothetical protein [Sphingomonas chungangi]